jgi:hypothetical protein
MNVGEIDEIYIVFKQILVAKLKIIQLEKIGASLITIQNYAEISVIYLQIKDLYANIRKYQEKLNLIYASNLHSDYLLQPFDLKATIDEIDENTIPLMKKYIMELENKKNKTEELVSQINLLRYFIN